MDEEAVLLWLGIGIGIGIGIHSSWIQDLGGEDWEG